MGWSIGYDSNWKRDIGYGVPATCDHPGCEEKIDRGLSFVCGGEPCGGEQGCGLFFCEKHLGYALVAGHLQGPQLCERCIMADDEEPFEPKPDLPEWIAWKLTDESWAEWRADHPEWIEKHRTAAA